MASVEPHPTKSSQVPSRLPRNVWVLAWVALFNDAATEMSYWLLPQFLARVLGAGPAAFGLIEGAAETVSSFGRLLSGYFSDRWRRRKPLVAVGYTVANLAKPLLAVARSWPQVFWIRFADRAAKGVRDAPRDALIADSVSVLQRGAAFGMRQAMDSAGAIIGPLSALALLPLFSGNVRSVFWMATVPGAVTILLAWLAVREIRPESRPAACPPRQAQSPNGAGPPARGPRAAGRSDSDRARAGAAVQVSGSPVTWHLTPETWLILCAVTLFSLGNSSDLFLVLRAQNLGIRASLAPALGFVFNLVYTVLSWPAGKLADRIPRRWLVVLGYGVYAGVYGGFAWLRQPAGWWVWALFATYGIYYALTEGVLKAWIADFVPSAARGSVYGLLNWIVGVTAFPASLLAGWLWQHYSPATPFAASSILALSAALLLLFA
jgi:MFS family permease